MRADQQRARGVGIATKNVRDFVHVRLESGLLHAAHEPAARLEIEGGQRHPLDPGLEPPDACKLPQIREQTIPVYFDHGWESLSI
jgi:hypothetical protein